MAELIKGKNVNQALAVLSYTPKYAALILEKTVKSAAANALAQAGTAKLKSEDLMVKSIAIDGGPVMKRIRPVGMGRAYLIRKPTAHVTVRLAEDEQARLRRERLARQQAEKGPAKKKETEKSAAKGKEAKGE